MTTKHPLRAITQPSDPRPMIQGGGLTNETSVGFMESDFRQGNP
jgi:hypothetical protein